MDFLLQVAGKVILLTRFYKLGIRLMEIRPSIRHSSQTEVADLDLLARIICDHIGDRFTLELERKGFHRRIDIHSLETLSTRPLIPPPIDPVVLNTEVEKTDALALLAMDITHLLRQRLKIEQERQGHFNGRLPW
jgi:hypothetical protein